jgi:hypothetical protein
MRKPVPMSVLSKCGLTLLLMAGVCAAQDADLEGRVSTPDNRSLEGGRVRVYSELRDEELATTAIQGSGDYVFEEGALGGVVGGLYIDFVPPRREAKTVAFQQIRLLASELPQRINKILPLNQPMAVQTRRAAAGVGEPAEAAPVDIAPAEPADKEGEPQQVAPDEQARGRSCNGVMRSGIEVLLSFEEFYYRTSARDRLTDTDREIRATIAEYLGEMGPAWVVRSRCGADDCDPTLYSALYQKQRSVFAQFGVPLPGRPVCQSAPCVSCYSRRPLFRFRRAFGPRWIRCR